MTTSPTPTLKLLKIKKNRVPFLLPKGYGEQQDRKVSAGANEKQR
jgi:hypothetical protein